MHWIRRHRRGRPPHPDVLTPAEWRVLEQVREGRANAEIAVRMGVSQSTVRTHLNSIYAKTGIADRQVLTQWEGQPAEASRAALGRFTLAAPLGWLRDAITAPWVAKGVLVGGLAALAVIAIVGLHAVSQGGGTVAPMPTPPPGTPVPTEGPVETPEPDDPDPGYRSGVWLIDAESGTVTVLHEGEDRAVAHFDPGGASVSVMVSLGNLNYRSLRFDLGGQVIEEYDDRLFIFLSPDGESRYYTSVAPDDLPRGRLVLEHGGVEVPLEDAPAGYSAGFSPSGDRLLTGTGLPVEDGEVPFLYRVHAVETGAVLLEFESRMREGTDGGLLPRWSPSGRFIADSGLAGLHVHDTETGEATALGAGWPHWSSLEDAVLAVDEAGNVDLVRFPGEDRTRLADQSTETTIWRFGAGGRYAYGSDWDAGETTVVDLGTGNVVAAWDRTAAAWPGMDPMIATAGGPAAAFHLPDERCHGIDLRDLPPSGGGSRCIEGREPRWSPDGRILAYVHERDVQVLDVIDGTARTLASGVAFDALARWNQAGTHLLVHWPGPDGPGWEE